MNLREISIEEARNLPSGSELWVGQTRQTARAAKRGTHDDDVEFNNGSSWCLNGGIKRDFGFKLFIPTPDAVPIEPDEAAARMVRGEPMEVNSKGNPPNAGWDKPLSGLPANAFGNFHWRIPAVPQKQRLVIEVDAGVEVRDTFSIMNDDHGPIYAAVKSRGVE